MSKTSDGRLNVGILGCGPIAQAGHCESFTKARNTKLHAICDVAEDLVERFAVTHGAEKSYLTYEDRLRDARGMIDEAGGDTLLAADSGIREHTVPGLCRAGADTIVMGSLAFGAEDVAGRMACVHSQEGPA